MTEETKDSEKCGACRIHEAQEDSKFCEGCEQWLKM